LSEHDPPIREEPTEAVDYANQPLKSLENQTTSKLWVGGAMSGRRSRNRHDWTMTIAGNFITALQEQQRIGNVSSETEQHLKYEFRTLGRDASGPTLAEAVEAEINRLARQADTLRRLRECLLGVG
jgi:hypothetical protein